MCTYAHIVYVVFFHPDSELEETTDTSRSGDEHLETRKSLLTEKLKQRGYIVVKFCLNYIKSCTLYISFGFVYCQLSTVNMYMYMLYDSNKSNTITVALPL